jgi:uncharacterized membrane protein
LSAISCVFTIAVRIPVAPTRGYIISVMWQLFLQLLFFGPVSRFWERNRYYALADMLGGYAQWDPISFCRARTSGVSDSALSTTC